MAPCFYHFIIVNASRYRLACISVKCFTSIHQRFCHLSSKLSSGPKEHSKLKENTTKRITSESKWQEFSAIVVGKLNFLRPYERVLTLTFVVFILCIVGYYYFFPDKMRDRMATEVSTVASKSLSDDELMANASVLSKEVVYNLLHDETLKEQASNFVTAVLMTKETKQATSSLLISVLEDRRVTDIISTKLKAIFLNILNADATREAVLKQIVKIIKDNDTKWAIATMLKEVTAQPEVQNTFLNVVLDVLSSKQVLDKGNQLGREISTTVLADKEVHKAAGTALWSSIKHTFSRQQSDPTVQDGKTGEEITLFE